MINKLIHYLLLSIVASLIACTPPAKESAKPKLPTTPFIMVLGTAQDAGYPQAACKKACCQKVWSGEATKKLVSCLGLVDPASGKHWIFDATPDFKEQLHLIQELPAAQGKDLSGIFLTHAHMGHYTGLMDLGREAMGAKEVPVFAMPRMVDYLTNNGPWSQLVSLENIRLNALRVDSTIQLNDDLKVTPFLVPHRDEYSETVGFKIEGANRSAIFIPDIDKWSKWNKNIVEEIKQVDYAFLDGTFFQNGELPGRDMRLIPHPFVEESMALFSTLSEEDKRKVYFIHFNHTNPLLQEGSAAQQQVKEAGFNVAKGLDWVDL